MLVVFQTMQILIKRLHWLKNIMMKFTKEEDAKLSFLANLASGLLTGTTRNQYRWYMEVLGQALGPAS